MHLTAEKWNETVPVGTEIRYFPIKGRDEFRVTKTRSEAWTLGSGDAVVLIEGQAGGVSIDHCVVGDGEWPFATEASLVKPRRKKACYLCSEGVARHGRSHGFHLAGVGMVDTTCPISKSRYEALVSKLQGVA